MPVYRKTTPSMLRMILQSRLSSAHASLGTAIFLRSSASNTSLREHKAFQTS
ncbi:unnamed protein product [Acanthoscelides obtectus]|uniref:Uncharacterized protein n=1 Tax=Acanthoscelides obtectus TaxID=200917 RepID=A0A9P0KCC0_ACAOB|nr:unnamed protein product [Acanthoscelides obtectus]CAK1633457.1 hypothetical protein AOBTE_LOCUS8150 [Acanthoscelides obtectus]